MIGYEKRVENDFIALLESMPFEEARRKILHRELGNHFDSTKHQLCLSWLRHEEERRRDLRESSTLRWARHAAYAAYTAAAIAFISMIITILKS